MHTAVTTCWSTNSQRLHRCCQLPNKLKISTARRIFHTFYNGPGNASAKTAPFGGGSLDLGLIILVRTSGDQIPPSLVIAGSRPLPNVIFWAHPSGPSRGVVTALKPVRAEQVRRPERKQNGLCHTVGLFCLYA